MDILKVLSRGTKRTAKTAQSSNAAAKLPSSTVVAATNPQLYNDDVRGQKRKRCATQQNTPKDSATEVLPAVDFFAPKSELVASEPTSYDPKTKNIQRASGLVSEPAKILPEDECRRILRSHRLKVTVMSKQGDERSKVQKSTKSTKSKAVMHECKEDDKKKSQLFPQPLEAFSQLRRTYNISCRVAENLLVQSYRVPTEVQLGSLPLLLRPELALGDSGMIDAKQGVDFLAVAPTGSGKTISFLIPAVNNIMRRRAINPDDPDATVTSHELEAIILVPTRELCHQIVSEGLKLVQGTGIKIMAMKKQMNINTEELELELTDDSDDSHASHDQDEHHRKDRNVQKMPKKNKATTAKPDILVSTPLLLLNYLTSGSAATHRVLPQVRDLVLDEADVLLDPLFRQHTMSVWSACINSDLRVSFWSATMGSSIESVIMDKLESRAKSNGTPPKPLIRLVVGLKDTAVPNILHKLTYTASEQGKLLALRQLLHPAVADDSAPPLRPPFIVFTQTIDRATALYEELKYDIPLEAGGLSRIAALHSGLPESARASIMRKFRAGEIWILITTDVLARGVDFAGINGVVNYDVPGSSAAYVHRAGRTGRAGREGGIAVTFYTKDDIPFVKTVANVIAASERQAGKTDDQASIQKWLLNALPNVKKTDRKKLRERGVESRRSGNAGANITSTSGYERRKENNRRGAIQGSKRRRMQRDDSDDDDGGVEWGGIEG